MSAILIVEDHALSRQALTTLLGYYGHRLLEATNGEEALALLDGEVPDLVITDIVMPVMDGIELVRRLREAPETMETPVIFYTATYRLPEARRLVEGLGKCSVVSKPCEPVELLRLVNDVLEVSAAVPAAQGHTDAATKWSTELQLASLVDLSLHLVSQRDPEQLLELSCEAFRSILNCRFVRLTLVAEGAVRSYGDALDALPGGAASCPGTREIFAEVVTGRRSLLRGAPEGDGGSLLAIPFATPKSVYGWLLFAQKVSGAPFDKKDGEMAAALGAQTALAYENLYLVKDLNAAKTANSVMERMVRTVAHEFRTPLGLLTGSADILDRYWDRLSPEKRLEQNDQIRNASRQIAHLVDSVLTFQPSGTQRQASQLLEIGAACRSMAAEVEAVWSAGHRFAVSIAKGCGLAALDEALLRRILQNLLSNAFRYTPPSGTVSLCVCRTDNVLHLQVADTGIGIPQEDQALVFEAFYRSWNVEGRRGLGLGLSIVKESLSLVGGSITMVSSVGKGTTMRVKLPLDSQIHVG